MMAQASAVRDYTTNEIEPLLAEQIKSGSCRIRVPSWAAQTNLRAWPSNSRTTPTRSRR